MKNLILSVLFPIFSAACMAAEKPNIVFIMADDLGPGWVDFDDANPEVNTPHLERLAKSGMFFTKA